MRLVSAPAAVPGPSSLIRRFGFSAPVGPRFYFVTGAALMALKYAGDVAIVLAATGKFWPPLQWLHPFHAARFEGLRVAAAGEWLLIAWALPFLWVGVCMSMRRAVDAGISAWWSLAFFVPLVNWLLMIVLSLLPSAPEPHWRSDSGAPRPDQMLRSAMIGVAAMIAVGTPLVALQTRWFETYAAGLFFGLPLALGAMTGFLFNFRHPRTLFATSGVVILGFALLSGALVLFALEGLACLVMAMPIALTVGTLGGWIGRAIALHATGGRAPAALAALALPLGMTAGDLAQPPAAREVITVVEIAAPPAVVWRHVATFEPIAPPRELLFRAGVAYPVRARLSGEGVGAVRRCEFSTGAFVEPITRWEEPSRLSFDVAESPPPLEEWSPYGRIVAPHLESGFRSRRGEFRLIPLPDGGTRLEGSTWYTLDVHPIPYWTLWADAIVHRIHRRVLDHIERLAERELQLASEWLTVPPVPVLPAQAGAGWADMVEVPYHGRPEAALLGGLDPRRSERVPRGCSPRDGIRVSPGSDRGQASGREAPEGLSECQRSGSRKGSQGGHLSRRLHREVPGRRVRAPRVPKEVAAWNLDSEVRC